MLGKWISALGQHRIEHASLNRSCLENGRRSVSQGAWLRMSSHAGTSAIHRELDLRTINEGILSGARTKSPEQYTSGIETHDFKVTSPNPRRSSIPKVPRRHSTINTNESLITNASASFEETAIWDQKALLSLGMVSIFHNFGDMASLTDKLRWRWYPWVLGPSHIGSPHEGNRTFGNHSF